jgi:hypothetical protein
MSAAERRYLHVLAYGYDGEGSASVDAGRGAAVVAPTPPELLDSAVAGLVQRLNLGESQRDHERCLSARAGVGAKVMHRPV